MSPVTRSQNSRHLITRWPWLLLAVFLTSLWFGLTVTLKLVDVKTTGDMPAVGWGTVNFWWHNLVGQQPVWHVISNVVAAVTLLAVVILLVWQIVLMRQRGFRSLGRSWWALDFTLIGLVGCYLLFQILVINYRPILINQHWEVAYPSSHVLLFATVWPLFIFTYCREMQSCRSLVVVFGISLMLIGIVARLLSGYHWLTDILGGILLGSVLVAWYRVCV